MLKLKQCGRERVRHHRKSLAHNFTRLIHAIIGGDETGLCLNRDSVVERQSESQRNGAINAINL